MKIGDRIIVASSEEGLGESLIGEKGTIIKKVNPEWTEGMDVVVNLDCGLTNLLFESERELEKIKY
ncbi:hypothetical protein JY816_05800 [Clostridioides difficile]|nr:hypothetical protein [Clostridioides difficile]MCJ0232434.1 hypothetical protein [Clostridioides difficile]MCJ0531526.1 hypothetical protein [Clostridioides difficile]HBF1879717.1 hypothetical protein [Clostridioides difficile]HBG8487760.1 hypothetical protein [Clostridioides difficile]